MGSLMRKASIVCGFAPLLAAAGLAVVSARGLAQEINIVSPRQDEMIQDSSGRVTVTVKANVREDQYIQLVLDGSLVGNPRKETGIDLEGVVRGSHQMEALLVDSEDRILATSPTVTFHMWQASALFPNARPQPKPRPGTPTPGPAPTPPQQQPKPVTPPKR